MEMFSSLKTFLPYLSTGGYGYYGGEVGAALLPSESWSCSVQT